MQTYYFKHFISICYAILFLVACDEPVKEKQKDFVIYSSIKIDSTLIPEKARLLKGQNTKDTLSCLLMEKDNEYLLYLEEDFDINKMVFIKDSIRFAKKYFAYIIIIREIIRKLC